MVYNIKTIINEIKQHKIYSRWQVYRANMHIGRDGNKLYNKNKTKFMTDDEMKLFMNNYNYSHSELNVLISYSSAVRSYDIISFIDKNVLREYFMKCNISDKNVKCSIKCGIYDIYDLGEIINMNIDDKCINEYIINKLINNIICINDLAFTQINQIHFRYLSYHSIDNLLISILLASHYVNHSKITALLRILFMDVNTERILHIERNSNLNCNLEHFKTILDKYVNDKNAISMLCHRNSLWAFYMYTKSSKRVYNINELPFDEIYMTKVPDHIIGMVSYDNIAYYKRYFIERNPYRVKFDITSIIEDCIRKHAKVDIFYNIPHLIPYYIYYSNTISGSDMNKIIDIYKTNNIELTKDVLMILIGKSKSKIHDKVSIFSTIINEII